MKALEQDILKRVKIFKDYRFTEADTAEKSYVRVQAFQMIDVTDITQEELGVLLKAIKEERISI